MIKTDTEHIAGAIEELAEEISLETLKAIEKATDETAEEGLEITKNKTLQAAIGGKKYIRGWRVRKSLRGAYKEAYIYNRQYQLTHLLERGHPIVRNGKVVGRSDARPHIRKAEEAIQKLYLKNLQNLNLKGD